MTRNRGKWGPRRRPPPREGEGLWVRSDLMPDGCTYQVSVDVGSDVTIPLGRQACIDYAMAVLTAAMHAQHDAAIVRQLTSIGIDMDTATMALTAVRKGRAPVDDAATEPLLFVPGVSAFTGKPFVELHLDGRPFGQLTAAQAAVHATWTLRTLTAADADQVYYQVLTGEFGLDAPRVRQIVAEIGEHYEWEVDE